MGSVSDGAADTRKNAAPKYSGVPSRLYFQGEHLCRPGIMSQWIRHGYGQEEEVSESTRGSKIHGAALRSHQVHAHKECYTSRFEDGESVFRS